LRGCSRGPVLAGSPSNGKTRADDHSVAFDRYEALPGQCGEQLILDDRGGVDESDEFNRMQARPAARAPTGERLREFVREKGDAVVCAMGMMIAGTSLNYVWNAYLPTYAQVQLHLSLTSSLQGIFVTSIVSCVLSPVFGMLADRVGAYRLFFFFIVGWLICVFPLFAYLLAEPAESSLMIVRVVGILFLTLQGAAHPGMLVKIFTVQGRSTGVCISYNTSVMLFGGLAPFYISLVARFTDARFIPPSYLFGTGVLAIVLVLSTRTGRRVLQADQAERGQRRAARRTGMQRAGSNDRAL